jgi:hypothetical protein
MPVETIWRRIAYLLEPPILRAENGFTSPFAAISVPDPAMVPYSVGDVVVLLGLAIWSFNRRDL